jgi:hypothetical protein
MTGCLRVVHQSGEVPQNFSKVRIPSGVETAKKHQPHISKSGCRATTQFLQIIFLRARELDS